MDLDYSNIYTGADFTFTAIDTAVSPHDTLKHAKQGTQQPLLLGIKTTVQTLNIVNFNISKEEKQSHPPKRPVTGLLYPRGIYNK
jgi:hypothetical protein